MAIAFVKNVGSGTAASSGTASVTVPASGVASGNVLVVRLYSSGAGAVISSIADTGGNTYSELVAKISGTDAAFLWRSLISVALSSGNTITATFSTTMDDVHLIVDEFSGLQNVEDGEVTATGSGTAPTANFTPTNAANLLIAHLGVDDGSADGFTQDADTDGGDAWNTLTTVTSGSNNISRGAYKITTSAVSQTYNPTLGTTRTWFEQIGSLKETAAGGAPEDVAPIIGGGFYY